MDEESDVGLWPLGPEDLPELQALVAAQGRNVSPEEYGRFLQLEGAGGLVLRNKNQLVGAITTMRLFEHGWLGPMLSTPELSTSLALVLYGHAVERLQRAGVERIETEATPEEANVLMRMGFELVRETRVLERAPQEPPGVSVVRPVEARHFLDVGSLDGAAVGYGRKEFLTSLHADDPESGFVVEREGDVAGYVFMRRSRRGYHVGPLVTRSTDAADARSLLEAAVGRGATWPLVALAPEKSALAGALLSTGFREVGRLVRLRAGKTPEPQATEGPHEWLVGSRLTG